MDSYCISSHKFFWFVVPFFLAIPKNNLLKKGCERLPHSPR